MISGLPKPARPIPQLIVLVCVIVCALLFLPFFPEIKFSYAKNDAQDTQGNSSPPTVLDEKHITSETDIYTLLSNLSDEQVRRLLITELKKDSLATTTAPKQTGPAAFLGNLLYTLSTGTDIFEEQVRQLLDHFPQVAPDLRMAFVKFCPYGTVKGAIGNILWVLFFIGVGLLAELIFRRAVLNKLFNKSFAAQNNRSGTDKIISGLVNEVPSLLRLFVFTGSAYFAYLAFIWTDSVYVQLLFLTVLISIIVFRLVGLASRLLFAPFSHSLRIVPVTPNIAIAMHRLFTWSAGYIILAVMLAVLLDRLGVNNRTIALLVLFLATALLLAAGVAVLIYKNQIRDQILNRSLAGGESVSWGRKQIAALWHLVALVYLFIIWLLLFNDLVNPNRHSRGAFILSFFVVPIWMVCDKLLQWIVLYAMGTLKIYQDHTGTITEDTEEERANREKGHKTYLRTLAVSRVGLVIALAVWLASLWDIKIPFISNLSSVVFDALIIMTMALLFWNFASSWIERKIQESIPEEEGNKEDQDDEWGSASARGRSYTLLPMIRKFLGTVLVVMVTMTILSSTGVDIGPLLAGAGVVGLAVGFGAQKLVADMFSGFFYLLDDAFRVGEYIEAGGISGTVENISLRNVMLRHHRGMLQIVPHSELGAVTNYMRGGIVVKFNLDFPYDADIDLIRKIIKKVGQAMLAEEEFANDFIQPVKSQGVREIANSVMTIRVKFTAKPGAHFIIRREAYKRITEALRAKGIFYAHKKVIVDIPHPTGDAAHDEQLAQAAGAAARQQLDEENQATDAAKTDTQFYDR